jgi:hypothetical protein
LSAGCEWVKKTPPGEAGGVFVFYSLLTRSVRRFGFTGWVLEESG